MKEKIENAIAILEAELRLTEPETEYDKGVDDGLAHALMVIKANVYDEEDKQ